ncbi:MAG: pyridoxamine 5'-phosphate oxidase family protein [Myxococcota bacterium]
MSNDALPDELSPAANAQQWLLQNHVATLSTTAVQNGLDGFPYGSVAPFALDAVGHPVILISSLAAHTKNLIADPRASLLVRQPDTGADPQSGWRVTLMGRFTRVERGHPDREDLHARYVQRVPDAVGYELTHDFDYWRMSDIVKARYIAGFGKITWLPGSALTASADEPWNDAAAGAVTHMNEDHSANLIEMCQGMYGITPAQATMTSLDPDGFFVRTEGPDRSWFFPFGSRISADGIRLAVIDVLKRARARVA